MGDGLKRARAAARATQLWWWTEGTTGLHWRLQVKPGDPVVGEVKYGGWWYASLYSDGLGEFKSCRAAKLAVRRALRMRLGAT